MSSGKADCMILLPVVLLKLARKKARRAALVKAKGRRSQMTLLPIVALKSTSYRHSEFGLIDKPALEIVGWDGAPQIAPAPAKRYWRPR